MGVNLFYTSLLVRARLMFGCAATGVSRWFRLFLLFVVVLDEVDDDNSTFSDNLALTCSVRESARSLVGFSGWIVGKTLLLLLLLSSEIVLFRNPFPLSSCLALRDFVLNGFLELLRNIELVVAVVDWRSRIDEDECCRFIRGFAALTCRSVSVCLGFWEVVC